MTSKACMCMAMPWTKTIMGNNSRHQSQASYLHIGSVLSLHGLAATSGGDPLTGDARESSDLTIRGRSAWRHCLPFIPYLVLIHTVFIIRYDLTYLGARLLPSTQIVQRLRCLGGSDGPIWKGQLGFWLPLSSCLAAFVASSDIPRRSPPLYIHSSILLCNTAYYSPAQP